MRKLLYTALAALAGAALWAPVVHADVSEFGLAAVEASLSTTQAGAHPDFTTSFEVKTDPNSKSNAFGLKEPYAVTRNVEIALPPGLIGNLNAVPPCTPGRLNSWAQPGGGCSNASQVGTSIIYAYLLQQAFDEPVYLMTPPGDGRSAARLGFVAGLFPTIVEARVRSESDYGITASVEDANGQQKLVKAETTLWGVPTDKRHDTERQTPEESFHGAQSSPPRPPDVSAAHPFLTNPTTCDGPMKVGFSVDSYQTGDVKSSLSAPLPPINGCDKITFAPRLSLQTTARAPSSPSGLDAELTVPQDETLQGLATSELRDSVVELPAGFTLAAGAAGGLEACSSVEVGYQQPGSSHCPEAAKIGSVEFDVPLLETPLHGAVYQRTPEPGRLFRIWLVTDEHGVHVKIPGEIEADKGTGQLRSLFIDTPQVPLRNLRLHFKEGSRAPLATPSACGTYHARFAFTPWSGKAPTTGEAPITVDQGCGALDFGAHLTAGSTTPTAGAFASFFVDLSVPDRSQNVATLAVDLPRGVLAKLAGVAVCPEATAPGGDCPPASRLGSVSVAAGVGPSPLWIPQPGKAPTSLYLAGPYKGAPYSMVVVVPAQAGPFDLGTVVTRAGIYVDPFTAQVTVKSDPLPQMLEGVPITYRSIVVSIDRPEFTLNPTSCAAKSVAATLTSASGTIATASSRFAVNACGELGFDPHLALRLKGGVRRTGHPALRAVLTYPQGRQANIARSEVLLPASEQIDNAHINNPCTRVQFNADACPKKSVLGTAKAWTPLLDKPLTGPVYFRSNGGERLLPDIVADLRGQIDVVLVGFIDSVKGPRGEVRIRNTFAQVPDAPVSKFILDLAGGKKGLLVSNTNLCARKQVALLRFTGQNDKRRNLRQAVKTSCGK